MCLRVTFIIHIVLQYLKRTYQELQESQLGKISDNKAPHFQMPFPRNGHKTYFIL